VLRIKFQIEWDFPAIMFFFETSHAFIQVDPRITGMAKPGGGPKSHTKRPTGKEEANLAKR
jgi:hypothetical protein